MNCVAGSFALAGEPGGVSAPCEIDGNFQLGYCYAYAGSAGYLTSLAGFESAGMPVSSWKRTVAVQDCLHASESPASPHAETLKAGRTEP